MNGLGLPTQRAWRWPMGLRKEVFVDEQGFSLEADRDEQDKNALHVLGLDETGAARCTARVFADAPGVWHAGRIAVQRGPLRGQGRGPAAAGGRGG